MDVVVGIIGVVGAVALVLLAVGGRAAREGRGEGHALLVAPRGARFGDATDLVLEAARREEIVRRHEHIPARQPEHTA